MLDFTNIAKALTDENRVRVLLALRGRELCVCQITAFLDLAPSTTSKHLSVLRQARLIESRKRGKWVYYALPEPAARSEGDGAPRRMAQEALAWVLASLKNNPVILADEERIERILALEVGFSDSGPEGGVRKPDTFHSLEIHSLARQDLPDDDGLDAPDPAR